MKKLEVYQIRKDAPDKHYKIFEPYDRLIKYFGEVNFNDYECIYDGLIEMNATLDDIFEMCNLNHPIGYLGHSLSVSDIVHINGKYYYCDSIGWKELDIQNN